jgi:hypothetical protein
VQSNYSDLLLQRLFGGDHSWAQAVYLAGMFAVLLWRKESVVNWRLFRISYLLYGGSIVLPAIITPLLPLAVQGRGIGSSEAQILTYAIINAIGPTLFAAALVCGLGSMMPRLKMTQSPGPPPKHPLD